MEDAIAEALLSEPGSSGLAQEVSRLWTLAAARSDQTSDANKESPEPSTPKETMLPAEKRDSKSLRMLNQEQRERKRQADMSRRLRVKKSLIPEPLDTKRRTAQMRRVRLKGGEVNTNAGLNVETEAALKVATEKVETEIKTEFVEAEGANVATRLVLDERLPAMGTPTSAVTRVLVDQPTDHIDPGKEKWLEQEGLFSRKERLEKDWLNRDCELEQNGELEQLVSEQSHVPVTDGCDTASEPPTAEPPFEDELRAALLPKTEPPSPECPSPEFAADEPFLAELFLAAPPIVELYEAEPPMAEPSATEPSSAEPASNPLKAKRPSRRSKAKRPKAKPKVKPRVKPRAKSEAEPEAEAPRRRQQVLTTEALERRRQHDRERDRSQRRMTKEQRERKRMLDRERQRHLTAEQRERKREYDRERQLLRARLKCGEVNSERELYAMGLTEEQQERKRMRERNRYRKKRGLPPIEQEAVGMTEEQRAFLKSRDLAEQNQIRLKREDQERSGTGPQEECPHCQRAFRWKTSLERHLLECGQEPNQHFLQAFLY